MNPLEEIARLKGIAEKATPGPWEFEYTGSGDYCIHTKAFDRRGDREIANLWRSYTDSGAFFKEGDPEFIATFSPSTVLKLLSALEMGLKLLDSLSHKDEYCIASESQEYMNGSQQAFNQVAEDARYIKSQVASLLEGGK